MGIISPRLTPTIELKQFNLRTIILELATWKRIKNIHCNTISNQSE